MTVDELIDAWDGHLVAIHRDRASGATFVVCVHSTVLGPGAGGIRMKGYQALADAIGDGQRLAAAMTSKFAVAGFPFGGGKAVIAVPEVPTGGARRRLLLEFGRFVDSLGGVYAGAPDINTSAADMDVIGSVTPHVFCRTEAAGGAGDTAPDTALGVFHGIAATVAWRFGVGVEGALRGRRVAIQGAGGVGGRLAELLVAAGAEVVAADPQASRLRALEVLGVDVVAPERVLFTECDVLAPCATGGILNAETIPRLRTPIVAGGANNQLADPAADARRLAGRDILYAPDFVINAGGILHGGGLEVLGWTREQLDARLRGIGDTLVALYRTAAQQRITTEAAATAIAARRLAGAAPLATRA